MITPAVNGTKGILETAVKHGYIPSMSDRIVTELRFNRSHIKRIVVTSSTSSVLLSPEAGRRYTEEDWNELAVGEVREKGKDASGIAKYSASKTLAERGGSNLRTLFHA